jgi:NADPH-dependent 2,4-dienoyl-CoA reductase/sulfur reductase-like enzyme
MGAAATTVHLADGINIRCGVVVSGFSTDGVTLATGDLVPADVIVVGIGVAPVTGWLDGSGLEVRDGVVCDATLAASPGVWAVGDLCRWPNRLYGEEMRIEHWTNAAEQGALAARNLLAMAQGGAPDAYEPVPFFWSDQGRHRIQFLGRSATDEDDEVVVAVGTTEQEKWLALYRRGDRLWGVLGANAPRYVMPYRKLLADAVSWDDALAFASTQQT